MDEARLAELMENPALATHAEVMTLAELDTPAPAATEVVASTEASASASASPATETATAQAATAATETPAPIQSRNGEHTIPYDVLLKARETAQSEAAARQAAEGRAAELQAQANQLAEQLKAVQAGTASQATQQAAAATETISTAELDALKEDFPVLAKLIESQNAMVEGLRNQLSTLTQAEAARTVQQEQAAVTSVQDVIDANPKLLHLQTSDPSAWEKAVQIDGFLQTQPDTANLSMDQRFAKVVSTYEALHGAINVPGATQQQSTSTSSKQTNEAAIRAAAAATVAAVKPAAPTSLSELPSGTAAASEEANLENMSATQIGARLNQMSPEAREAFLNSLG